MTKQELPHAAATGIGMIAALVTAILVILMPLSGHALAQAPGGQPPAAIAMAPEAFDKFAGFYQLGPKAVFAVTRDGDHFFARAGSQPPAEIFPKGETSFFLKAVPAQLDFTLDAQGKVSGAVLHQGGRDISLPRIDEAQAKAIAALPKGHPMPRTWQVMAGVTPRFLTSSGGDTLDYWPCFSPDGKTVLFSRTADRGRSWALWRVDVAGGTAAPFANPPLTVTATRAAWSAKNNLIAFSGADSNGKNSIWIIKGDGTGAHAVAVSGELEQLYYPSWYPDGKTLGVMDAKNFVFRRMSMEGGAATALTDRSQVMTGMPSVSPDGKWVAFAGQANKGQSYDNGENAIWLLGEDGKLHTLEATPFQGRTPVWSPDGKRLAFESDRGNPDGHYAIYLINRDGSGLTQVTDMALDANHPVFSADGRHMVFSYGTPSAKANGIAIVDLP
jgi:Tol biopolymer transport system component